MESTITLPVSFKQGAIEEIKRLMAQPEFLEGKKMRVGVKGGGCSGMTYVLEFDDAKPNDMQFEIDGIECVMDKGHQLYLYGIEIDWEGGLNSRGFTFKNPNASSTCGCGTSFAV